MSRIGRSTAVMACAVLVHCSNSFENPLADGLTADQEALLIERAIDEIESTETFTPDNFEQLQRNHFETITEEMRDPALENLQKHLDLIGPKIGERKVTAYIDLVLLGMHMRICEVLDVWGLEAPPDEDAAQVFALSGSPEHRAAARVFCGSSQAALNRLFEPASGLMVFKNLSLCVRPGLNELWREHILGVEHMEGAS